MSGVDFIRLARRVRAHLDQTHRFAHVLRVARTAVALARAHGVDVEQARLAGMLHDLARLYSSERLVAECREHGLAIDDYERANPIVLHARLGAALARSEFGVDDPAVLSAIARHTVAAAEMSPLDAIVYLADGLEPGRDFAARAGLLALAFRNLDEAMYAVIDNGFTYARARGYVPAPQTFAAFATYARRLHREKRSA
jgi:predicted HD superfamily hydrolase involved in NAD metabolism